DIDKQINAAKKSDDNDLLILLETRKIIAEEIIAAKNKNDETMLKTLSIACTLEGSVRQTGVHACGILIGRDNLENNIPLMRPKGKEESDIPATQYEGSFVESIGLLKMDFLGLRTLSIIKECLANIKLSRKIDFDIEKIPLDDEATLEIFRQGATTSIFQFESEGMKSNLRMLKPTHIDDLVAMNALYRPGPMDYIPDYIARKNGTKKIEYDHPIMEIHLKSTYGITVYQEQVMLLSRALANFSRGKSDTLRKAMGKKNIDTMKSLYAEFVTGCLNNEEFIKGCEEVKKEPNTLIKKIWKDWEAFAKYAFNKSHSVCYAYIAYQTAYLKAHFPAEFMAANLTKNISDIEKISTQMDECKRMKINVLNPDINESYAGFMVNKNGAIRFGLSGIKNVGKNAVESIIEKRDEKGSYADIFDFVSRVNISAVNKKNIEALVFSGAFDCFTDIKREQYFAKTKDDETFIEALIKFANNVQNSTNTGMTLFGDMEDIAIAKPVIPTPKDYNSLVYLEQEKEHIGMYLTRHPLDQFKFVIERMKFTPLREMPSEDDEIKINNFRIIGYVTEVIERFTKNNNPYGKITMLDYSGAYTFTLFGKEYAEFKNFFTKDYSIIINGSFRPRFKDDTKKSLCVSNVSLLADYTNNISNLTIPLSYYDITDKLTNEIMSILQKKENNGNTKIYFKLYDPENQNTIIKMVSKYKKITLTEEIIDFLENNTYFDTKNISLN
ncbi:DNA polymerase III subunit alpha, partial [Bacteroidales bacterium OttesenSCG-928-I21]|nr:DNA polymerase III subunit alpha [Bacteroidales bacterium OttesenSCG-928-I21]